MEVWLMRIECKDAQGFCSTQKLFQYVRFGNLRLGGSEIFTLDRLIDLMSMDRNMAGRSNPDLYVAAPDVEYRDFNFIADHKALIFFSCKYQHPCLSLQGVRGPAHWEADYASWPSASF